MNQKKLKLLAICGSLKASSSNAVIIRELASFADQYTEVVIYNELESLPQFNPDKEAGDHTVSNLRVLLKEADGVIISTPEYAFGVPGALKNALDWTVSSGELNEKPVIAVSASPLYEGGAKALASLLLTLSALGTDMTQKSSLSIANISKKISNGRITDPDTINSLKEIFQQLLVTINSKQYPER